MPEGYLLECAGGHCSHCSHGQGRDPKTSSTKMEPKDRERDYYRSVDARRRTGGLTKSHYQAHSHAPAHAPAPLMVPVCAARAALGYDRGCGLDVKCPILRLPNPGPAVATICKVRSALEIARLVCVEHSRGSPSRYLACWPSRSVRPPRRRRRALPPRSTC